MTEMVLTPEEALAHIDRCIEHWRAKRDRAKVQRQYSNYEKAVCYVDAWQSARISLFGGLLPEGDERCGDGYEERTS